MAMKILLVFFFVLFFGLKISSAATPQFSEKFYRCKVDKECKIYWNACLPGWVDVLNSKYETKIYRIIESTGANNQACEAVEIDPLGYKSVAHCMAGKCAREVIKEKKK